ncbi:MAG: Rpn family recombination-promoting nuclease/putative transposase [Firmicutes bacterium]|nr:Rpn family recombination-promoting nuclease/putative transposase [Bacillota bacterium]
MPKNETKLQYTFKSDILFKMLFVRYPELLQRLVAALLSIPLISIDGFIVENSEIPPEEVGTKFCRLDIRMTVAGKHINLEIQVQNEGNFLERTMFNWAKMYSTALPKGENYKELPQAIVINILDFVQFNCKEVYSKFMPMETTRHEVLSDKQQYHFFELPKMPNVATIDTTSEQDLWLALFNASTEEELEELISKGGKVMGQAVTAYRSITADEQYKYLERLRDKRERDEAQALSNARDKGIVEGIIKGKIEGKIEGKTEGIENMLLSAIKNNAPISLIENMRQDAGISLERLAELQQQAKAKL